MSIQDMADNIKLVQNYNEFKAAKQVIDDAIGICDGAIQKLEASSGFLEHVSKEEQEEINVYRTKVQSVQAVNPIIKEEYV